MRFGFVTCVQLGLDVMEEIYSLGGSLQLAVSLPDDRARDKSGRIYLDDFCAHHSIPIVKTPSINDHAVAETVLSSQIDWLFIIGWSQIAKTGVLSSPARGCIGMHPTLLPEGRGRASIPWAIIKGIETTGVTMFVLDEGVDTGPILAQTAIPLRCDTSASELYRDVEEAHRRLIRNSWRDLADDRLEPRPQDPSAGSVWPGRTPEDGRLAPDMTVTEALTLIRATTHPYPGAFWVVDGGTLRVWSAQADTSGGHPKFACRDGWIEALDFDFDLCEG